MESTAQLLLDAALHLPADSREELADQLYLSLHAEPDGDPSEVEAAWSEEIARRVADVLSGSAKTTPAEEVHRRLREKLNG
jgi:putative addiction module component (TIGR02574 family)